MEKAHNQETDYEAEFSIQLRDMWRGSAMSSQPPAFPVEMNASVLDGGLAPKPT